MELPKKFFLFTFGCRCNQADSAAIRDSLNCNSYQETANPHDADFVIINTCTVTRRSDQQARQTVRKLHRENPRARLIVTGCYAERDPQTVAGLSGVSLVIGNAQRHLIADVLPKEPDPLGAGILHDPISEVHDCLMPPMSRTGGKTRPFIKLQDGCDARCSYCIVPFVRGPGRSAKPEDVLREITALVGQGYQEIVLVGVNLGTYGKRLDRPASLLDLLKNILEIPGLGRLRLSSIEPMRFDRGIVRLAVQYPALARHFHIPLQSGSDRILRLMRRPYTAARFLDLLVFIRENLPGAGIGTDVLVGFPGETDSDFEETCEVIRGSPVTYLHVFPFSAREGTDAESMPGRVPPGVVTERARILREISTARSFEFRKRFIGATLPAIGLAKEESEGEGIALTDNYIPVRIADKPVPPKQLIEVRIDDVRANGTWGTLL